MRQGRAGQGWGQPPLGLLAPGRWGLATPPQGTGRQAALLAPAGRSRLEERRPGPAARGHMGRGGGGDAAASGLCDCRDAAAAGRLRPPNAGAGRSGPGPDGGPRLGAAGRSPAPPASAQGLGFTAGAGPGPALRGQAVVQRPAPHPGPEGRAALRQQTERPGEALRTPPRRETRGKRQEGGGCARSGRRAGRAEGPAAGDVPGQGRAGAGSRKDAPCGDPATAEGKPVLGLTPPGRAGPCPRHCGASSRAAVAPQCGAPALLQRPGRSGPGCATRAVEAASSAPSSPPPRSAPLRCTQRAGSAGLSPAPAPWPGQRCGPAPAPSAPDAAAAGGGARHRKCGGAQVPQPPPPPHRLLPAAHARASHPSARAPCAAYAPGSAAGAGAAGCGAPSRAGPLCRPRLSPHLRAQVAAGERVPAGPSPKPRPLVPGGGERCGGSVRGWRDTAEPGLPAASAPVRPGAAEPSPAPPGSMSRTPLTSPGPRLPPSAPQQSARGGAGAGRSPRSFYRIWLVVTGISAHS